MSTQTAVVPTSLEGVRVDKAVALVADISRSAVDRLIAAGQVRVDGRPVTSRRAVLRAGQRLEIDTSDEPAAGAPGPEPDVEVVVVHEDDDLVVVDKPAGLVVHPGAGHATGTLVNGLLARYPELAALPGAVGGDPERPGVVHRLDRGTSGLLVVARTPAAYRSLVDQLAARSVARRYRALVVGAVDGTGGVVDAPIGRSVRAPTRMAVSKRGKEARTRYRVERRFTQPAPATLVVASLETGRTHQIRVHLAAIGHPVVGDDAYAGGATLAGTALSRPFLHATWLGLDHPVTGRSLSWTSPLPDDLEAVLHRLR